MPDAAAPSIIAQLGILSYKGGYKDKEEEVAKYTCIYDVQLLARCLQ